MKKCILFLLIFISSSVIAVAVDLLRTNTGFYYPGNIISSPYFGFNTKVAGVGCHLAKDYKLSQGSPVYAVGSGVVEQANSNVLFYGSDVGAPGGAIIIKHTTADNKVFYALYGHLNNFKVKKGDSVIGGQQIADIGPYISQGGSLPHLHFGINTTSARFQGYTPTTSCVNQLGFVDPEIYITTNSAKVTAVESCKAFDDSASTTKNTIVTTSSVITNDTDSDADTLSVSTADSTSKNGVAITNNNDGTFTYTPAIDFVGTDSFNYTVSDNNGCSDQAKVTITVAAGSSTNNSSDSSGGGSLGILMVLALLSIRRVKLVLKTRGGAMHLINH